MVLIGGSAGSLEAILQLVPALPGDASVVYVLIVHRRNDADSILERLLSTRTTMTVSEVEDKDPILPDQIYIAPPGYHLLIEDDSSFSLDGSEKIHYSRPSIDVCFESAAQVFGDRTIGILLSGANEDGVVGLQRIVEAGGLALVQDPQTAEFPLMPAKAVEKVKEAVVGDIEGLVGVLKKELFV